MFKRAGLLVTVLLSLLFTSALSLADVPIDSGCDVQVEQSDFDGGVMLPAEHTPLKKIGLLANAEDGRIRKSFNLTHLVDANSDLLFEVGWRN